MNCTPTITIITPSFPDGSSGATTGAAGGDLTGTYPAPDLSATAIHGKTEQTEANDNDEVLVWNSQEDDLRRMKVSALLSGATGEPGGELEDGSITTEKLADNAVTDAKIRNEAIQTAHIADGAVTDDKIESLTYDKVTGAPTSYPPTGSAGGDLIGPYPDPSIATGAVTEDKLADGAVTDAKVANGISYTKLTGAPTTLPPNGLAGGDLTGYYPNPNIGDGAITGEKIADGSVTQDKLALDVTVAPSGAAGGDLAGTYPHPTIANDAITGEKLADGSVTEGKLADGAVTDAKIADGISYTKLTDIPTSLPPNGTAGGDLTGSYPNPMIADKAITFAKLQDMAPGLMGRSATGNGSPEVITIGTGFTLENGTLSAASMGTNKGTILAPIMTAISVAAESTVYVAPYKSGMSTSMLSFTMPYAATIGNLVVTLDGIQSGGGPLIFSVLRNDEDTAVSLQVPGGGGNGTYSQHVATASFEPGDRVSISITNQAFAGSASIVSIALTAV